VAQLLKTKANTKTTAERAMQRPPRHGSRTIAVNHSMPEPGQG